MSGADQYGWVYTEYSSSTGWDTDPFDVTAFTPISSVYDNEVASGTTPTPSGDGLAVAMFRLRDGAGPVGDLAFTDGYSLVGRDGTEYGNSWSLEAIMAGNTTTDTVAQSTVASWTAGDTRIWRGGVIAVFLPASQQQASATVDDVNAAEAGLFDRRGGNTAFQGSYLITETGTINATAAVFQTSGVTVVTETMYYVFGGQAVAMRRIIDDVDQGVEFLLSDHLGSTSISYAADGSDTRRQYYNPYGEIRATSEPVIGTDIGYTGQRLDTSTDLMFYNARYYDPLIARFISADTIIPTQPTHKTSTGIRM